MNLIKRLINKFSIENQDFFLAVHQKTDLTGSVFLMDISSVDHTEKMFPEFHSLSKTKKAIHLPDKHSCFMEEEDFPLKETTKNIPPNGMLLILCHVYAQV
jgi:hypothetical protein